MMVSTLNETLRIFFQPSLRWLTLQIFTSQLEILHFKDFSNLLLNKISMAFEEDIVEVVQRIRNTTSLFMYEPTRDPRAPIKKDKNH